MAMGTMMATMDASITNIALPELTHVFHKDLDAVMWVTVAFLLASSSLMLISGRISDLVGRKRIYAAGMAIFTLGMGACSLAQSIEQIILFRVIQAIGAAMSISCGAAIVTAAFRAAELGKGLGYLGISVSAGFILGPVVGGFLLDLLDWRSLFYMRIPMGVVTFLMAIILLEKDSGRSGKIQLDLIGTLTSSGGLFCLCFGLSQIRGHGPTAPVFLFLGAGLVILILFVLVERHVAFPIVDLSLFKNRVFSCATAGLFLFFVAAPPYIMIMPFYLLEGLRLNPAETGLLLAVVSMTTIIIGPISGSVSDRLGPVWPSTLGAVATAASFFFMLRFDLQTQIPTIILVLILLGFGVGAFQPPNNTILMGAAEKECLGSASALIATERQVGISLGMALAGTVFSARRAMYLDALRSKGMGDLDMLRLSIPPAYHDVLLISLTLCLATVVLSLLSYPRFKNDLPIY